MDKENEETRPQKAIDTTGMHDVCNRKVEHVTEEEKRLGSTVGRLQCMVR